MLIEALVAFILANATPTVIKGSYVAPKQEWRGIASYYSYAGCVGCSKDMIMANGDKFEENAMTIAFNKLSLGSFVEVTNVSNGQAVTVEVTDTGGFESLGRIADLSLGVKEVINCTDLCEVVVREK